MDTIQTVTKKKTSITHLIKFNKSEQNNSKYCVNATHNLTILI